MPADFSRSLRTIFPSETRQPQVADLWQSARTLGFPVALWRLPLQSDKHLLVSFDQTLPRVIADLDELPAGFLLSPFDNVDRGVDEPAHSFFLRADVQVRVQNEVVSVVRTGQESGDFSATATQFWQHVRQQPTNSPTTPNQVEVLTNDSAHDRYIRSATDAVAAMQRGDFRKVVLSRTKHLRFTEDLDVVALFDKLCAQYPSAFISAVFLPETGQVWMSATPERLVSISANGLFQTAALAGTQSARKPDGTTKRAAEALWSQKEIEEQAIVCRYIIECFKKIRLREYVEEGPRTVTAGNLMHLGTSFTVDTRAVHYPQLATVMLRLLHPTSAVCGTPRQEAFDFIRQHEGYGEGYDREFYSGFLGPVNIGDASTEAASHLFVHIRCLKLEGRQATLYAGAGLTADSIPEHEWQETELKCDTLLNVIRQV